MSDGGEKGDYGQTYERVNCSVTQEWIWGGASTATSRLKSGSQNL